MEIIGYVVYGIGVVLAAIWILGIRTYTQRGQGVAMSTVNMTMLFIVSLILVPALGMSPFHLLWLYPASVVVGLLSLAFPFSLLSIPGNVLFRLACFGLDPREVQTKKRPAPHELRHMNIVVSRLPNWLRWTLLVPASLVGGFLAGYFIHLVNVAQAASPTAPIVFIAEFLAGLASNLIAFHIAYVFAPSHQKTVMVVLVSLAIVASFASIHSVLREEDYPDLLLVAGNLLACYIAWRRYLRTNA